MKIRKIQHRDLFLCEKILKDAYSKPPYNEVFEGINAKKYIETKYKNCNKNSFVAIDENNKIIGFIFLSISAWSSGKQAILEEIVIKVDLQKRGIGKKLLEHTSNYLKSLGIKSIMLWAKNNEYLLKFYKDQGFFVADDFVVMFKNFSNKKD